MKQLLRHAKKGMKQGSAHYYMFAPQEIYAGYLTEELHNSLYKISKMQKRS